MLQRIKEYFKREPKFKNYPELRTVFAFSSGGVDYFEFEDSNNLTQGRGYAALNYYKELSMSCTREFLLAHVEAVDKIVRDNKKIDIIEIARLNLQLKERLEMAIDSITPYKLASVIYFDKTEDPYSFDYGYALKKIEKWKKEGVSSFFLQMPLRNLIPSTLLLEENLENYMKVAREIDLTHYKNILDVTSQVLSESQKSSDWLNRLRSEKNII
jgi:predicted nucleotidyltransferase